MTPREYNHDFAWINHFGGGLHGPRLGGLRPSSRAFETAVRAFQADVGLDVDGYFGPKTLAEHTRIYGPPSRCAHGIDISGHQREDDHNESTDSLDEIHFEELQNAGFSFAIIKALQGEGVEAERCRDHTTNAEATDMAVGHYHFAMPRPFDPGSARRQAVRFSEVMSEYTYDRLIPAVDVENKGYKQRTTDDGRKLDECVYGQRMYDLWRGGTESRLEYVRLMSTWFAEYLDHVDRLFGCAPLLYSYPSFLRKRIDVDAVGQIIFECPLWIAAYTMQDPRQPYAIDGRFNIVVQQWTSDGDDRTRPIFDHGLDLNRAPWGLCSITR